MKSPEYLDYIRTLPCCHCGAAAEPHHVIGGKSGTMGGKASDLHAVPLCREDHNEVHKDPDSWPQLRWLKDTQDRASRDGVLIVAPKSKWSEFI